MTTRTGQASEAIDPAAGYGARYGAITAADVAGIIVLPNSVRRVVRLFNVAHQARAAITAEYVTRFPAHWAGNAPDARGRAVVRSLVRSEGPVELPEDLIDPILDAERVEHVMHLQRGALDAAAEESERILDEAMTDGSIIPALAAGLDTLLAAVRRLPLDTPTTAEAALDALPGQQEAYRALTRLLEAHRAIRAAQAAIRARRPSKDTRGLFTESPVLPGDGRTPTVGAEIVRAGPSDPVARLRWLAGDGAGWVPTCEAQDAAFEAWAQVASQGTATVARGPRIERAATL